MEFIDLKTQYQRLKPQLAFGLEFVAKAKANKPKA